MKTILTALAWLSVAISFVALLALVVVVAP